MIDQQKFWKLTRWARAIRFWLFLGAIALAYLGCSGEARAQAGNCGISGGVAATNDTFSTAEEAKAFCEARHPNLIKNNNTGFHDRFSPRKCVVNTTLKNITIIYEHLAVYSSCEDFFSGRNASKDVSFAAYPWTTLCPVGVQWDPVGQKCGTGCENKPDLGAFSAKGSENMCSDGCQYQQKGELTVCLGEGPSMFCGSPAWESTGQQCAAGDPSPTPYNPDAPTCVSSGGGFNHCVKPGGTHCVTGAKGTVMCWAPGEATSPPRMGPDGTEGAHRATPPDVPQPPSNQNDPAPAGNPTRAVINGIVYVGQGFTGSGAGPGQSSTGPGGTGSGSGSGSGTGDGTGDGPGAPGGDLGNMYQGTGDTIEGVFAAFQTRISGAPVLIAASDFFTVSGGSGCPVFTMPAADYWASMTFDHHCAGSFAALLAACGWLVLAVAAFAAFKIGFY